jgi:hypothetical protein
VSAGGDGGEGAEKPNSATNSKRLKCPQSEKKE